MKTLIALIALAISACDLPKGPPVQPPFLVGEVVVSVSSSYEGDIQAGRKYVVTNAHKNGIWYLQVRELGDKRPVTPDWYTFQYFREVTPGSVEMAPVEK